MKTIDAMRTHISNLRYQGLMQVAMVDVEKCLEEIERELEEEYVALPKDANGEVFRLGCEVKPVKRNTELVYTVYGMTYGKDGWKIYVSGDRHAIEREPSFFEVCEPPTVEDVLREFALKCEDAGYAGPKVEAIASEFAERLQLRGEDE